MPDRAAEMTGGKCFELWVSLWNKERDIKLNFPPEWEVIECRMAGHDMPPLLDSLINEAFENPIH